VLFESCLPHSHADGMLDRAVIHGFARGLSLEQVLFGSVNFIVCFKQWKHCRGQDGKPVPASFPGNYLELHDLSRASGSALEICFISRKRSSLSLIPVP